MQRKTQLGFLIYVLAVIAVSLLPSRTLVETGSADKVGHFLAYAIMTYWGLTAFNSRQSSILLILFCLSLGAVLEYAQLFVSGRDPSMADSLANVLGVLIGVLVYFLMRRLIRR